ncbi:MAG: anhydro-N-acetylmuramic acid kinase [Candidatus Zhuqueibacterota bacterium]
MHPLVRILNKDTRLAIGLMSGTSMDGIDAALVQIKGSGESTSLELIHFAMLPYPDTLREALLTMSQPGNGTVEQICQMNFIVGEYFADAALEICRQAGIDERQVDFIGSHGQTVHHLPTPRRVFDKWSRSTLQIGESGIIANRTGIVTVANFRSADMAENGQGAPLIPNFDYLLFQSKEKNRVLLNIGGIANYTILKKGGEKADVIAYDTGPGNMVINALMKILFNQDFDEDGAVALRGIVAEEVLNELKQHEYFSKAIPKSTGREEFGNTFVLKLLERTEKLRLSSEDIIATATELTAWAIADAFKFSAVHLNEVDELIVSGGGVYNRAMMASLKRKFRNSQVLTTTDFGIPADAKEAICFAVLANETISGNPANLPTVTGASRSVILGTISFA